MLVTSKELIKAIKGLTDGKSLTEILDLILPELTEVQLNTIIQLILDPTYKEKEAVLTSPNRFTSKGELKQGLNSSLTINHITEEETLKTFSPQKESYSDLREKLNSEITDEEIEQIEKIKNSVIKEGLLNTLVKEKAEQPINEVEKVEC